MESNIVQSNLPDIHENHQKESNRYTKTAEIGQRVRIKRRKIPSPDKSSALKTSGGGDHTTRA